jgi:hypothetical protein
MGTFSYPRYLNHNSLFSFKNFLNGLLPADSGFILVNLILSFSPQAAGGGGSRKGGGSSRKKQGSTDPRSG